MSHKIQIIIDENVEKSMSDDPFCKASIVGEDTYILVSTEMQLKDILTFIKCQKKS